MPTPYGHATCCGCEREINLANTPDCIDIRAGNMIVYLFFCRTCFTSLKLKNKQTHHLVAETALKRAARHFPAQCGLAMTTSLALQAHSGDLVKAYEIGVQIPRVIHDAIIAGEAEAVIFPDFDLGEAQ